MEDDVPWLNHGVPNNGVLMESDYVPCANYGVSLEVSKIIPKKNAAVSNGVSLEFTGITPWTNEPHDEFVTGITPPKHERHVKDVASPGGNADYLKNITPRINETCNFDPAVTGRSVATGTTPRKNEFHDGVPNNGVPMETDAEFAT